MQSKCNATHPEQCVDLLIVWHNPCDKCKRAQTRPDVVWKPEQNERKNSEVGKEAITAHPPTIGRGIVLLFMQGAEKDGRGEGRRPDEGSRVNQPSTGKASKAKSAMSVREIQAVADSYPTHPSICEVKR